MSVVQRAVMLCKMNEPEWRGSIDISLFGRPGLVEVLLTIAPRGGPVDLSPANRPGTGLGGPLPSGGAEPLIPPLPRNWDSLLN